MTAGHLIHIGYPKTGSNFLRRWFAAHPELGFANRGLAGFENVYAMARYGASPDSRPRWHVTSAEPLSAPDGRIGQLRIDYDREPGPMAEAQARVCATLASLFPSAHILIVTRGFRAMILSAYSQYVRTGGTESFETFYRPGHFVPWREAWDYDHLIALYRNAFPGRVILLPYELLRDDPAGFTGALAGRLGVAPCDPPAGRLNAGLSPVELAWYPRLTRFVRALPVGARLRRRIEGRYLRAARRNRLAGPVSLLQRLRPKPPIGDHLLTDDLARSLWGQCDALRDEPLYAPYLADYFL